MACKEDVCGFVSVSRDFTESFRKVIDKSTIKFVRSVKLETKSGKSEDKILVLTTWRLHLLSPKVPAKVEITFNFLEIQAMNTFPEHQVVIDTDKSSYSLRLQTRDHLDNVINYISFALSRILNSTAFAPSVCRTEGEQTNGSRKVSPSSETSVETQRACGGFSEAYAALCDYNGISCKEEVQWDVDTIYHSQDNREFNLLDFSHLESRDLAVIVAAIAYNTWFTKIYCKDMRIGSEVTDQVLHTLSKSSSMEELTLENVGLRSDFPQKLSVALSENPASSIHSLNLAHNTLDNQGVSNLIQQVCRLSKGLRLLNLSRTCLTSKGVVSLSQALCSSDEYSNSLLHLDLSRNPGVLSGEDASNLYLFLSQANCLVHLDLSGTDCVVDSLFTPLLRGCCADLSYLNLSRNSFSHRKGKDSLPVFRQFFSSAFSLTHVSLACMKLPPEALRALFLGLSANPHISDLHLDISGCELRCAGAAVIQELLPRVSSIGTLDISDNGLDGDLVFVLPALSRHPSLKHLLLGKNFNIKNRVLDEVLQKLVQLIQDEECGLQSLSLADSRLRSRGTVLVNALGSNTCLRKVDLSGNGLEDIGAKMLSKALQINTTLRSVMWDRNNTMSTGFMDVARALEHNFTLQYMPLPLSDVTQAYRNNPEKTEQALTKIQRALLRNNQTQRFSQRQALRLHQGLVTSTAEQVMERLCVRVQQQVCVLREAGLTDDIQAAKQVLKEARNSRALYPSLCELAHVLSVDGPVRQKLDSLAGELAKAADKELQVIVDSMVSLCRELCPMSSTSAERLSPSLSSVAERVCVPRSAIRGALMERAAQDIHRALEEVKLSVVSYLTNSIVDQLLQELYATHKSLTHHVADMKCWDGENETEQHLHRHRDSLDITDEELGTNIDTLAIRKRSGRTRRIRPVSSRLTGVCDDSSSSTPPSAVPLSSPPLSSPLSRAGSSECLSALPTQGTPLSHVTRIRPRPPRKHRRAHAPVLVHCAENGAVTSLEDGLPDFYTKRVLPDSQLSSHHKAQSLRRKKRRNMLAIFSFRRSRQSALANHSSDTAEWGVACGEECRTVATTPSGTATENVYTLLQPPSHSAKADRLAEVDERKATEQMWDCNTHRQVSETERETERQTNGEKQSQRQSGEDQTGRRAHRLSGTDITSGRQTQKDRQSLDKETQECWETSIFQLGRIDAPDRQTISDRHVMSLTQMDRHIVSDPLIDRQVMSLTQITCDRQLDTFDRNITSPVLADRQSGSDTFHRMDCISSSKMPDRQDRHTYSRTVCGKNVDRQKTLAAHTAWRASSFRSGERQTQSDRVATTVTQHTGYITQADKQTVSRTQTERQTVSLTKTDRQTVCPMQTDRQTLCLTPAERQIVSRFHLDRQTGSSAQKESVMQADRQISVTNSQQDKQAVHVPQTSRHTVFITLLDRQKIPVTQTDGQTESITGSDIQTAYSDRQIGSVSHLDRPTVHSTQSDRHVGTVMQPDRQKMSITQSERQTIPVTQSDRQTRTDFQSDRKAGNELQPDIHSASVTHAERHVGIMIQSDRQTGSVLHIDRPTVPVIPTEIQTGGVTQINKHSVQPDGQTGFIKQTDRETVPLTQTGCVQMGSLTQSDRQTVRPVKAVSLEESRRPAEGLQRAVSYGRKPDPPPQSSKPNLAKLRQRPLQSSSVPEADVCVDGGEKEKREDVDRHTHTHGPEKSLPNTAVREKLPQQSVACDTGNSQTACPGEECVKAAAPVKPLRNRKALSCDKGMDGEESNNTERPPNRKPPVKKPRLPQNRNRSLELLENGNAASPGNSVTP